jgi:polyhydroxybutyrate depolymerase
VMRRAAGAVLAALACGGCAAGSRGGTARQAELRVGDTIRTFQLFVPRRLTQRGPVPLVLAFHGTGESGAAFRAATGFDRLAARDGFLVAYPDAAVGNWAEGCDCSRADRLGINDTGFVRTLIDSLSGRFPVDPSRVFAVGFSQGGLFAQRLACELAGRIAGVASVSAPISAALAERCGPQWPVSVLVLMGTLDDAYPYEGRGVGPRATLGARAAVALWRALDACDPSAVATALPDRVADGTTVLEERWPRCAGGREVGLYTVDGGRHAWSPSQDVNTTEVVTAFFLRQARTRGPRPARPEASQRPAAGRPG